MTEQQKQARINELGKRIKPWKDEMPIDIYNLRNEIIEACYTLFDYVEDIDKEFSTKTQYGLKPINRAAIFEAILVLFQVDKDEDGTSHFYYDPLKGASFVTKLFEKAINIYAKEKRKNPPTVPIEDDPSGPIIVGPEPPDPDEINMWGRFMREIENSFAGLESKCKKYLSFRALFTHNILIRFRRDYNSKMSDDEYRNLILDIEEKESDLMSILDVDFQSFRKYKELWKDNEKKITDRPVFESGFIEYYINSPIDRINEIMQNEYIKDAEGKVRFQRNRDYALQKYFGEKNSLYVSYIKPFNEMMDKIFYYVWDNNS